MMRPPFDKMMALFYQTGDRSVKNFQNCAECQLQVWNWPQRDGNSQKLRRCKQEDTTDGRL